MKKAALLSDFIDTYSGRIDEEIQKLFSRSPREMYGMMEYFMGYADEQFNSIQDIHAGKRFRSGLCLLIADRYGVVNDALAAAVSIEVFHNFTLIHDDIADKDEARRGRPAVWKLWGTNCAINTGDAQLLLALKALAPLHEKKYGADIYAFLIERYLEVAEGQHLDFLLSDISLDDKRVAEDLYLEMVTKKTSILVGAAARSVGIIAETNSTEQELLSRYGLSLGLAYQLSDDASSIWGKVERTGKDEHGDIREKKKTLPILYALSTLSDPGREELITLYRKEAPLDHASVKRIIALLDSVDARGYMQGRIDTYRTQAHDAAEHLSLPTADKGVLVRFANALLL